MIIRICSFTNIGQELAAKLNNVLNDDLVIIKASDESTDDFVRDAFTKGSPLVFIGACGIAVRKIATYVSDKLTDIPVLVIDEMGQYIIPILSGHIGGANRLAKTIATAINGQAVITTGTDVEGILSIDVFAAENGLVIINRDGIRKVSSKLLSGSDITMAIDENSAKYIDTSVLPEKVKMTGYSDVLVPDSESVDTGVLDTANTTADVIITENVDSLVPAMSLNTSELPSLILRPKHYVIGIGCKANTPAEIIEDKIIEAAKLLNMTIDELIADTFTLATIDLKKKERGLLEFAQKYRLPLETYSADELNAVAGDFYESEFVKSITGVSNVCERASVLAACKGRRANAAAGEKAIAADVDLVASGLHNASGMSEEHTEPELVCHKLAGNGVTIAIARR